MPPSPERVESGAGAGAGAGGGAGAVPDAGAARLPRFDAAARWLHWSNAVLFLVLLVTASALYLDPVSRLVGRRALMRDVHVYAGLLLPVPYVVAFTVASTARLRDDARRLNRWTADDTRWMRSLGHDPSVRLGKFHPGQKVNAAVIAGAVPVMLGTGVVMRWFGPFPLAWRTGATFVHDWLAVVVFAFVVGHIGKALSDRGALRGMWSGWVTPAWARRHRPRWYEESVAVGPESGSRAG